MSELTVANTEAYERWNGEAGERWVSYQSGFDAMARRLTPRLLDAAAIEPGDVVVDVGCGSGDTSRLAAARALANLEFVQADAQTYPFPRGGVDVVLSRFGAMGYVDPPAAYGNFAGALRPGGRLAVLCWQDALANELMTVPFRALAGVVPGLPAEPPADLGPFARRDPARLRDLVVGAGFTEAGVESLAEPVWLGDTPAAATELLLASGPAHLLLGTLDAGTRERARDAVRAALAGHAAADGVWLGSAAWLVTGRR